MTPATKIEWRRWAAALDPVPPDVAARVSEHVASFVENVDGIVLGFSALVDEVTVGPLTGVVALPRLGDDGTITVHLDEAERERHAHGFEQPPAGLMEVDPGDLGAVLVPGRVFDRAGYRLGRGGGHYDRLLARLATGTPAVGVTCAARIVDRLPREPHDIPMSHLATEHGVVAVGGGRSSPTRE